MDIKKHEVLMIVHDILATHWDAHAEGFLEWYLAEFWSSVPCGEDLPVFVIFLNLKYPARIDGVRRLRWQFIRKRRIIKAMARIEKTEICRCLRFDELKDVTKHHIDAWLVKHGIDLSEGVKQKKIDEIFKGKDRVAMVNIEEWLESIIDEIDRKRSGLH
jgi:hypothetical protein